LPASVTVLDVLARLDAVDLARAVRVGEVTPSTTRVQAVRPVERWGPETTRGTVIALRPDQAVDAVERDSYQLTSRTLWRQPAKQLLDFLRRGGVEVQSADDVVLLGDLRAALEDVEIPEE
jgi:hypothetical protein